MEKLNRISIEIEVFNAIGFKSGDYVKIVMDDGTEEVIQLERGKIYMGVPERKNYTTNEIIPATPPMLVVQTTQETPTGRGIPIADVRDVILIKRLD